MRLGANHTNEHRMRENSMPKLRDVIGGTHTKIYRQATVSVFCNAAWYSTVFCRDHCDYHQRGT
jgi:hypothetical protein